MKNLYSSLPFLLWVYHYVSLCLFLQGAGTVNAAELGRAPDAETCDPSECHIPKCHCPSSSPPGNIEPSKTPQVILITFDDAVHSVNIDYFRAIFNPKYKNPNGCPIGGTFFVSDAADGFGLETQYEVAKELHGRGLEIAVHSLSHTYPEQWWSGNATYKDYVKEMVGQRRKISQRAGIPEGDLVGVRVPFMSIGGDNMYKALYDNNFVYDKSMLTGSPHFKDRSLPLFPYTLDFPPQVGTVCDNGRVGSLNCPRGSYPGFWAVPVNRPFRKEAGESCNGADALGCDFAEDEDVFEFYVHNFNLHYENNRAPLCLLLHSSWFKSHPEGVDIVKQFIEYVASYKDVYIITVHELVQWMKQPTDLSQIHNFKPWRTRCTGDEKSTDFSDLFLDFLNSPYVYFIFAIFGLFLLLFGRRCLWRCRRLLISVGKTTDGKTERVKIDY
ncbi:uncharacterized protein LOC106167975 [Lingula anatina]|uniref:Uncharacterized protein LOC106167975 n=1 Tax=Lingula anatina TaxID=7574 RepID=A0A1S3IXR9_LINAN|nr:uncharacterized protein LOC106167975 [Lingula anatina]|eukprot:XP_013402344.1 uncharacterized protein LOC106167975 [Lingula anatina]